jgi:hypothetical protein
LLLLVSRYSLQILTSALPFQSRVGLVTVTTQLPAKDLNYHPFDDITSLFPF